MSVQIIHDADQDVACCYCNTSDWAFGSAFTGPEAREQAECWLDWFTDGKAAEIARSRRIIPILGLDDRDPRSYTHGDLETLYGEWAKACTNDDGLIYSHHPEDGSTDWAWRTKVPA